MQCETLCREKHKSVPLHWCPSHVSIGTASRILNPLEILLVGVGDRRGMSRGDGSMQFWTLRSSCMAHMYPYVSWGTCGGPSTCRVLVRISSPATLSRGNRPFRRTQRESILRIGLPSMEMIFFCRVMDSDASPRVGGAEGTIVPVKSTQPKGQMCHCRRGEHGNGGKIDIPQPSGLAVRVDQRLS